jgi:hypothetical protein
LLAAPMLFVIVLTGSRSSWLYLLFATGLAYLWQRREQSLRPLLHYSLALVLGFWLMHFVAQIPWLQGADGSITTLERMFGVASGNARLHLWREAMLILFRFPLIGAGFGQFAYQHLQLAAELRNPAFTGLYNNAHNLVMQTAAEAGAVGLAVLLGTLGLWFWNSVVRNAQFTLYHWWGYAVLAVLGIHSMLEYPLWYAYFIGIAAVMLGIFDTTTHRLELRNIGRASVAMMLVLGAVSLLQAFQDYKRLEHALALRGMVARDRSLISRVQEELMVVHQSSLLGSYAELFIASTMELSADHLKDKLELNERALHFIPIAPVVYHQVWLLALSDRPAEAKIQLERAIWAYSGDYSTARAELGELARKDPARFTPLLEFATQKYEEYQRAAIPAR